MGTRLPKRHLSPANRLVVNAIKTKLVRAKLTEQDDAQRIQAIARDRENACNQPGFCQVCNPTEEGLCLWRRGIMQAAQRPDLLGVRADVRVLATDEGQNRVIVMQAIAPEVDVTNGQIKGIASILAQRVPLVMLADASGEVVSVVSSDAALAQVGAKVVARMGLDPAQVKALDPPPVRKAPEDVEEGDRCPIEDCDGFLHLPPVENCSCHLGGAPCSACERSFLLTCEDCGWVAE